MKKIIESIRLPLLVACMYILSHRFIEGIISDTIVSPILSKVVFVENPLSKLAYALILLFLTVWGYKKLAGGFRFSFLWIPWSILVCLIYLYYRGEGTTWAMTPLFKGVPFFAMDILLITPIFFVFSRWKQHEEANATQLESVGFMRDDDKIINKDLDPHERHRFITQIKDRILNTTQGKSAFCIGVIGPWGSGKTTFLNTLKKEFDKTDDIIQIDFSPWQKSGEASLTEAFFDEFSFVLSHYTDSLSSNIGRYGRLLVAGSKSSLTGRIFREVLPSFAWHLSSVEELKGTIGESLKKLNRRVVVFLDDIDRLDQEEIQEVFRLVRNSAGFPNVFYIIAFDKLQVERSLKEKFELGFDKYLEKILQVEFYLPPISKAEIMKELRIFLKARLDDENQKLLDKLFEGNDEFPQASLRWISDYLNHHRDVVRFINQFDLHFNFVNGRIYLPDFLALMVLRLKYPEFYYYLYKNQFIILTFKQRDAHGYDASGLMVLAGEPHEAKGLHNTKLKALLKEGIPEAGIKPGDFGPFEILKYVFETNNSAGALPDWPVFRTGYKNYLSVKYSQYFTRYFDYSFTGRLDDVAFEEALKHPPLLFQQQLDSWCEVPELGREVVQSLERITAVIDQHRFEKIVIALIRIASRDYKGESYTVDKGKFLDRFYLRSADNEKRLLFMYGTVDKIKHFLYDALSTNCTVGSWCYHAVARIADEEEGFYPLTKSQAAGIIVKACKEYFNKSPKIDYDFRSYMLDWNNFSLKAGITSPMSGIQNYMLTNVKDTVKLFVGLCHKHFDERHYRFFEDPIKAFWNSEDFFIERINKIDPMVGKELLDLKLKISNNTSEGHVCTPFQFEVLSSSFSKEQ